MRVKMYSWLATDCACSFYTLFLRLSMLYSKVASYYNYRVVFVAFLNMLRLRRSWSVVRSIFKIRV